MKQEPIPVQILFDGLAAEARRHRVERCLDDRRRRRLHRAATARRHTAGALLLLFLVGVPSSVTARDLDPSIRFSSPLGHAHALALSNTIVSTL